MLPPTRSSLRAWAALNIAAFLSLGRPGLAFAFFLFAFAGMPLQWDLVMRLNRIEHIGIALIIYCMVRAVRSRSPEGALLGAFAIGMGIPWLTSWTFHAALQAAAVFFLAHSLRWTDAQNPRDPILRNVAGFFWVLDSFIWTRQGWPETGAVAVAALFILATWAVYYWRTKQRGSLIPAASSVLVLFSGPANWFFENSSPGLIALAASLLLFGLGAVLAFTRHRWNLSGSARLPEP